ncbi:MAG: Uma2 family endonuclease [Acidimicrobiales bacterium]
MAVQARLSIEEFMAREWPRGTQLVDGEPVMNDPSFPHQRVVACLLVALTVWTRAGEGRGEAGVGGNWTLAPSQLYIPDVWWTPPAARPGEDAIRCDTPPGLVAEVRSPGTWHVDVGRKRQVYEERGVAELWLVDTPPARVAILRRSRPGSPTFDLSAEMVSGDTLTTPLLDGFLLAVDDLFGS